MQYPEFGTQVGRLKSLWLTLLGMTGLGQGASQSLPTAAVVHQSGMSSAATSMSSSVASMHSTEPSCCCMLTNGLLLLAGFTDNSSVSVISTPDQKELYTMTESVAGTYRADLGSLATLGAVKFNDGVSGLLTTAHPTLMEDGTLINITNGVCSSS